MYPNPNANVPNWNSPLPGGNISNMNPVPQQIPSSYPYPSQVQVPNFPQQMPQYGTPNMPYPQNNQNGIRGRVITDISQVTPNEVPMDGTVSLFATSDYSCIYAKQWAADGTIKTMKYIPVVSTENLVQNENPVELLRNEVMGRLDDIVAMVAGIGAQTTPKKTANVKKEVSTNE